MNGWCIEHLLGDTDEGLRSLTKGLDIKIRMGESTKARK